MFGVFALVYVVGLSAFSVRTLDVLLKNAAKLRAAHRSYVADSQSAGSPNLNANGTSSQQGAVGAQSSIVTPITRHRRATTTGAGGGAASVVEEQARNLYLAVRFQQAVYTLTLIQALLGIFVCKRYCDLCSLIFLCLD